MQLYFLTKEEIQFIFRMKNDVTKVKMNMKNLCETHEFSICMKENETQEHVYICEKIVI